MLNPKELKGVTFKKNLGGSYNASEVDDFLAGLIDDYTKIYTDNAELSMKLELMAERLAAYKGEEQKLRTAVANVKLLCDNLIKDANEKSEKIVKTAMAERDSIVVALEDTIRQKRSEIETINASVAEYKENMIFKYKMHIDAINSLPLFDVKASDELVTKSEKKLEELKVYEQEIPILLDEKKEETVEEVAEFIEPTEPKEPLHTVTQEQQIIKAKVVGTRKIDASTAVFERPVIKAEKATDEPTVVFDSKEVVRKAEKTKKPAPFAFAEEEEKTVEEKPVEGQTTFEEVEPEIEIPKETVTEYIKPTEDILEKFAPKEEKKVIVEEKEKEPEEDDDEIDVPKFFGNRRKNRSSEQEKKTLIENIKIALAEKEEEERIRIEKEEAEEREMESIVTSALPIDDNEAEENIESKFKGDIRFGSDFDYEDDDDDDDDDDGFFSFFKSKN